MGPVEYNGHPDALLTIESSPLGWCAPLPAVQHTRQWRTGYRTHIRIALDFLRDLRASKCHSSPVEPGEALEGLYPDWLLPCSACRP
ncbi:hypothetical protein LZ023_28190 [Pseudomonas silvicola]|nr:hypothetical protein LZ023_28190 [Pseudomonas silvicola]